MGGTCVISLGTVKNMYIKFQSETLTERDHWTCVDIRVWTGCICFRIGSFGRLLQTYKFHER